MKKQYSVAAVIFDRFELLDMFGPLEMLGMYPETFSLKMVAEQNGSVASAQGPCSLVDATFSDAEQYDILLVPGGAGTRSEVQNPVMLDWLKSQSAGADFVTSVCTGSALLAKAGLLDGLRATTNKRAFEFVTANGPDVEWIKEARWVEDGKYLTSSGVSAGTDMSLALVEKILGRDAAEQAAVWAEYEWHQDASWDPFAKICGLVK